jgi:hypothetical protein
MERGLSLVDHIRHCANQTLRDVLRISSLENLKRFLVKGNGTPFVWIGDTLWVWQKLNLSEIEEY